MRSEVGGGARSAIQHPPSPAACRVQEARSSLAPRPPMAPNTRGGPISDGIFYHHRGNPIIPPPALSRKISTTQFYSCREVRMHTHNIGAHSSHSWYHPTVSWVYFALSVVHYCKHSSYAQRTTTDEKHADADGRAEGTREERRRRRRVEHDMTRLSRRRPPHRRIRRRRRRRCDREREGALLRPSFSSLHLPFSARQRPTGGGRTRPAEGKGERGDESAMWSERKTNDASSQVWCEHLQRAVGEAPPTARCRARSQS